MFLALLSFASIATANTYEVIPNIKDGYLNVRGEASSKSKVIGRLFPSQIFHSNSDEGMGWLKVSGFTLKGLPKTLNVRNRRIYVRSIKKHPALKLAKPTPIELHTRPGVTGMMCTPKKTSRCKTILKPGAELKHLNSEWIELSTGWEFYYEVIYAQTDTGKKIDSGRGWAKAIHFKRKEAVMTASPTALQSATQRPHQTSSIF